MIVNCINRVINKFGFSMSVSRMHSNNAEEVSVINKSVKTDRIVKYETPTGDYYLPADAVQDIVANTIIRGEVFEKEVVELASNYIARDTVVLDVGSNFGQMAILFAKMVGENGKVFAFDADDFVFKILEKNIELNKLSRVIKPFFGAVHDNDDETLLFPEQDFVRFGSYGSYGIDYNATKGRKVKTLTIDSLGIQEHVSFMKIDIQGGDLLALKGAMKTIEKNKMPILFEYEYQLEEEFNMKFQDYVDFVTKIDYKFEKVINGHNFLIIPK